MNVTIAFHGMCALASHGKRTDALLLPEMKNNVPMHLPVLAIPVADYIIPNVTIQPDMVGHNGLEEIAFWNLQGVTIQVGSDTPDPAWRNLAGGFALGIYHRGAKPKSEADQRAAVGTDGAIVELTSGALEFPPLPLVKVDVTRNVNGTLDPVMTSEYPSSVQWSGDAAPKLAIVKGGKNYSIELNSGGRGLLSITNVAREASPKGLEHFSQYYQLLDLAKDDGPLELKEAQADITVYDCVPPVVLPTP